MFSWPKSKCWATARRRDRISSWRETAQQSRQHSGCRVLGPSLASFYISPPSQWYTLLPPGKPPLVARAHLPRVPITSNQGSPTDCTYGFERIHTIQSREPDPGRALGENMTQNTSFWMNKAWTLHMANSTKRVSENAKNFPPCMVRTLIHNERNSNWK